MDSGVTRTELIAFANAVEKTGCGPFFDRFAKRLQQAEDDQVDLEALLASVCETNIEAGMCADFRDEISGFLKEVMASAKDDDPAILSLADGFAVGVESFYMSLLITAMLFPELVHDEEAKKYLVDANKCLKILKLPSLPRFSDNKKRNLDLFIDSAEQIGAVEFEVPAGPHADFLRTWDPEPPYH